MRSKKAPFWKTISPLTVLLLAAGAFYAVFIVRTAFRVHGELYFTLIDDAMVSMRYAHHLAQGHGLVWNVGEAPVQGFTNPGWTLLMAAVHLLPLPLSKTSLVIMIVSAVLLVANVLVVHRLCRAVAPEARYAPWIAGGITAFYFPLVFWSLRGMEVGALTLLVDLAVLLELRLRNNAGWRDLALLGLILILMLVVRLDSVLQVSIILAYVLASGSVKRTRGILLLTIAAAALIGILCLQRVYFGDALPNTYYQKMVGAPVLDRIKNGLLAFNQYATRDTLMLALFAAGGVVLHRGMRSRETALLAAIFLVQCLYSIWVGGDYAEPEVNSANRFITQGMPALIVLFSLAADRVLVDVAEKRVPPDPAGQRRQLPTAAGVTLAVLVIISGQPWINWAIDNAPLLKADVRRVRAGLAIAENTSPNATIASHAAGQIPYYSHRKTIDLLGLNDPVIAKGPLAGPFYPGHDKWNYDYSITQRKPDLIADNWIRLGDFMRGNTAYQQLENGMYVRKGTALVNVQGLLQSFP
jgi:arabinofuranosyltransferase